MLIGSRQFSKKDGISKHSWFENFTRTIGAANREKYKKEKCGEKLVVACLLVERRIFIRLERVETEIFYGGQIEI
jgi:hypothetical protein